MLLLSGDLDVRTPLEEQAEATAGLKRLHRILVRNGGHDLFEAHPDVPAILVDFFSEAEGGGDRAYAGSPVALNLFQGPGRISSRVDDRMLKRVQHDGS